MNKNLIALAVAAASISSVATAAEVYSDEVSSLAVGGRFEARAALSDGDVTDKTRVRLNIAGKTDITDTVYGLGFYEAEYTSKGTSDDDGNVNNRYLNAGIGGNFGQVVFGKADGSLGMLTDVTDIMAFHGNGAGSKIAAADRTSNNLAYTGSFDNLTVKANYVFEGNSNTDKTVNPITDLVTEETIDFKDGYALSAMYQLDMGLGFGAGYSEQDVVAEKTQKQTFATISYTVGDFYVGGLYQDARNTIADEAQGYEFAAAYTMGKTVFTGTYNYLENKTNNVDAVDAFAVDATYYFNKNFRTYASYNFNQIDNAEDEFVLGARYDF